MSKWIKNTDIIDHTWAGQTILAGTYYNIQKTEEFIFSENIQLLTDITSGIAVVAKDDSGTLDITDINQAINFLKDIPNQTDDDGREVLRTAAAKKGWSYVALPIEVETSKLNGVFCSDWENNDRANYTLKFYDSNNVELVAGTQLELDSSCVKTVVTFSPNHDYELMGGSVRQTGLPISDVRVWVIGGAPELGAAGVKEFIGGINMKMVPIGDRLETDGRASKLMKLTTVGVQYATNQLQFILRHNAGFKHNLIFIMEYFRA